MRVKRSIEEIEQSKVCNFSELCIVLEVPRSTLSLLQKNYSMFPFELSDNGKTKLYNIKKCKKVYSAYLAKIAEGFRPSAAAKKVSSM